MNNYHIKESIIVKYPTSTFSCWCETEESELNSIKAERIRKIREKKLKRILKW